MSEGEDQQDGGNAEEPSGEEREQLAQEGRHQQTEQEESDEEA
jgi:hypothetical protein